MEFLGVGPLELLFIFLIALIVLGPRDIVKTGRTMGRFLNKVVTSPTWQTIRQTSREMRTLPTRLMREAGVEEELKDINRDVQELKKISSSFNLKDMDKEVKEPFQELSDKTKHITDQPAIQTSTSVSDTSSPPDAESNQSNPANYQQESESASAEPENS
jgi:sec-independent protein translocase protein TatB